MRHIDNRFIEDLLHGDLAYFLTQVKAHPGVLSLEIRNGYINIYYKGGNLLKITQKAKGYTFHFDAKYCNNKGDDRNFQLLSNLRCDNIRDFEKHFHLMMQEMDSWFEAHPKPERDYQHQLLVNNPEIIDIEYQIGRRMRLDMLMYTNNRLLIVENKYGTGAISGKAGIAEHYSDICEVIRDNKLLDELINSVCHISKAKHALGLTDKVITPTDIQSIEILFLLANYNPNSCELRHEVNRMDRSFPASVLFLSADQTLLDVNHTKNLFMEEML